MASRGPLVAAILALVPLIAAGALLLATAGRAKSADFELLPINPGGPVGLAHLEQEGDRLEGRIAVWGLGPGSRHLAELTGPWPPCSPEGERSGPRALGLPQLVADPNGVAFARVATRAPASVIEPGYGLTVYAGPSASRGNVRVSCGALTSGRSLAPSELANVGPGAGARARVSTILQLRDGRPIGGAERIEARAGDRVALAIRSDLPDEVAIAGLGLSQQVGPATIARFSFVAPRAGRFPLRARTAGPRPVAVLVVHARRPSA